MTSKEIRDSFIDFFQAKNHRIVPSAPMVVKDDPTLMFTNAGMNQFKDIILGNVPIKYLRVANSQKCLRVSGKHNDLEEVGHDTYHHTMFEMLGNWSFGDYFKQEAIGWAWEYLTEVLKLDKERFYATIFEGAADENLERDDEAASYWEKYLPKERIINGSRDDNFWEMGDIGPCGPCSEIHIDIRSDEERAKLDGAELVNRDHPEVVEIWNLVFMQYNRKADGSLEPLPAKVIDTGMGFERLAMAVQGKNSNYDTDLFQPLIKRIGAISNRPYGDDEKIDIAMRVIADHVRSIAFSIADGELPSNSKGGYVIRRILRRAVRYGYTFLDMYQPFIYRLVPTLIEVMGEAYPEIAAQQELVAKVIQEEEESFLHTLENGMKLLERNLPKSEEEKLSGEMVFKLYDTFGFPPDLTELILRERGMQVDLDGFNREMLKQRDRARNAASVEAGDWIKVGKGESEFVGYDEVESDTNIVRYRRVKQKEGEFYQILLSRTPFYAELGGQVGDSGWLISESGEAIDIFDTKSENRLILHLTKRLPQDINGQFKAKIDIEKREATECNHSATHLMHEALREVLGSHVEQRGSYVSPELLRFDFSHFQKMSLEEIREVEMLVTKKVRENIPIEECRDMPIEEAKAQGAIALFGEKYGEEVRTVRFGSSFELCGGTHISATGRIGTFRIISEGAISAGVRRIEAVTAKVCEDWLYNKEDILRNLRSRFNNAADLIQAVEQLQSDNEKIKKELQRHVRERMELMRLEIIEAKAVIGGVDVFKAINDDVTADMMKDIAFQLKEEFPQRMLFVAGTASKERANLTVMLSDDLVAEGYHAGNMVREAAKLIGGGGGGQPHFATAGGKNREGLAAAVDSIVKELKSS